MKTEKIGRVSCYMLNSGGSNHVYETTIFLAQLFVPLGFKPLYQQVRDDIIEKCPDFEDHHLKEIVSKIAPKFSKGLFMHKPFKRNMRYIGGLRGDNFTVGKVYVSESFNGACVIVEDDVGKKQENGSAYFELA